MALDDRAKSRVFRNILRHAMPLIPAHGFTRECLSNAAASVTGAQSFGDTEVTALFGRGDEAKKTFIRAWLKEGLHDMATTHPNVAIAEPSGSAKPSNLEHLLRRRLMYNENVLRHLPEVSWRCSFSCSLNNVQLLIGPIISGCSSSGRYTSPFTAGSKPPRRARIGYS